MICVASVLSGQQTSLRRPAGPTFALDDARSYFASKRERYDLILSVPSNPWVAGVSGLFTTEFYAHVRRFMAPHGIFAQWIHLSETNDEAPSSASSRMRARRELSRLRAVYGGEQGHPDRRDERCQAPAPDWSILKRPGIASDLNRILPITPGMLDALHIILSTRRRSRR